MTPCWLSATRRRPGSRSPSQAELATEFGRITRADHLLDLGCGPGILTDALSRVAGEAEGVDFAANMIRVARRRFPDLRFQVANGEELPFGDSHFDVTVCNYTAHHFARPERVFREILRTLKPDGRVIVIHPIQAGQMSWGSFAEALAEVLPPEELPGGPLLATADPEDFERLLSHCGYSVVRAERRVKPLVMPNIDQLWEAGFRIAGLQDQPPEIQDQIRTGTFARAAKFRESDGSYRFPDAVLVATAQKPA